MIWRGAPLLVFRFLKNSAAPVFELKGEGRSGIRSGEDKATLVFDLEKVAPPTPWFFDLKG